MKKHTTALFTFLSLSIFAQNITQFAQGIPQQFNLEAPKIVDFAERAMYDSINPAPIAQISIEQIEDKDENFEFVNKAIIDSTSYRFNINSPVHQTRAALSSPAPIVNVNGVMDAGRLIPPDIRGAAGSTYVMETTNQEFKIFTKWGALYKTVSIPTFFSSSGGSGYFDPHVCFDMTYGRWIIVIGGKGSNGHYGVHLAVSLTDNPEGSWYLYFHDGARLTSDFIDYPLLGYNKNWVAITANNFTGTGGIIGKIYVFNRQSIYSGTATTAFEFTDNSAYTLSPAETYDANQATLYCVQEWNSNSNGYGYVKIAAITGTASAPVYSSGVTLGVDKTWSGSSVAPPQLGSAQTLEGADAKIGNCIYRNNSLWFCHTAPLPASGVNHSAVQWWQVNPATPSVIQFGRIEQSGVYNFYPSIAVNAANDVVVGYAQSSTSMYASAAYSVRAYSDSANSMRSEVVYKSGVASYYKIYSGFRNRWGDYFGACSDPSTNSFWVFGQWANTSNRWATQVANIPSISSLVCLPPTTLISSNITDSTVTLSWNSISGATSYNVAINEKDSASRIIPTNLLTLSLGGLKKGTVYEWRVQPVCSTASYYSSTVSFLTTGWICNPPTDLYPSNLIRLNQVTAISNVFSWTSNPTAQSYHVQVRKLGTTVWRDLYTVTNVLVVDSLFPITTYEWRMQSVCLGGSTSAYVNGGNFTTKSMPACFAVTNPTTGDVRATSARAAWKYSNSVYVKFSTFRYKAVSSPTWITIDTVCSGCGSYPYFSFAFNPACSNCLIPGTQYEWQVRQNCLDTGANCCLQSSWNSSTYFTTLNCQPIGSVSIGNITTTSVFLAWGGQTGIGYKIYYKQASSSSWTSITTTSTSYTLPNLSSGTAYNWTVRNTCSTDTSSLYPIQTFTTMSCIYYPTTLSTSNISYDRATFSWNQDLTSDGYKVQWRKVGTSTFSSSIITNKTIVFYAASGFTPNTNYEWQIASKCGTGFSPFSQLVQFRTTSNCQPTNVTATYVLPPTDVMMNWYNVGSANYICRWKPVALSTWNYIVTSALNARGSCSPATDYEWQVASLCGTDTSAYTASTYFTTGGNSVMYNENASVTFFPNPSDGTVTIQGWGLDLDIEIFNSIGQSVLKDKCVDECVIFTNFNTGIYTLKINDKYLRMFVISTP